MTRWTLLLILLVGISPQLHATGEGGANPAAQEQEQGQPAAADEGEEKGIIPKPADLLRSSQAVTPITQFPEKPAYDQAREDLAKAETLWAKGEAEAASDTALEAYDDLMELHRRSKRERKKLLTERRRAAAIYVQGGIRFIQDFVNKAGRAPQAIQEGRDRLEDLRDVARNYPELNQTLSQAEDQLH
jgi:hypothetical protein